MPFLSLIKKIEDIASCISRTNRRKREQNRRRCSQKLERGPMHSLSWKNGRVKWAKTIANLDPHMCNRN
jgi:hypothetical protein